MKKTLPVVIVVVLIVIFGGIVGYNFYSLRYEPVDDYLDYAEQMGLEDNEYTITLNNELLSSRAEEADGRIYLGMELVRNSVNTRFYWDENEKLLLYTTPTQTFMFSPDEEIYTVRTWDGETEGNEGYAVIRNIDGGYYIAADYVTANTCMEYAVYTDPGRVMMITEWGEEDIVTVNKDGAGIRYRGGVKSELLRTASLGEKLTVLDVYDNWTNVSTQDGYIGWISNDDISDVMTVTTSAPDFDGPEYTRIEKDYKISMGWHQVMNMTANSTVSEVLASAAGMNTISPTWFWFEDTDGTVNSIASHDYVQTCHNAGVEVWALFSNEFSDDGDTRVFDSDKTDKVLGYTSKRADVIGQIMDYVSDYEIDGINIDFENISTDGADDYVEFIRELSIACRANGIVLSVDNYVPKYTQYYNRTEQGIVADYIVIMGYDETTEGSETAGPVASIGFVEEGITDTLALVDASKVINGIPFYTRVWSTDSNGNISSFSCGMTEAAGYLSNHDVTPELLSEEGLYYGSYTSGINGNLYEIWLQDDYAVAREMALVREYDLAGAAAWKLGLESGQDIWDIITEYLTEE